MENTAERVRQLSKQWLESGDDHFLNQINDLAKRSLNVEVLSRRFLERYRDALLEVHFHIGIAGKLSGVVTIEKCAVAQFRPGDKQPGHSARGVAIKLNCGDEDSCQRQIPVFVDIFEMVESPKGVVLRNVPSFIRLQTLDHCFGLKGNTAKLVPSNLFVEVVEGLADGKHIGPSGRLLIGEDKLPNDMVESRPEIVEKLSDDNAKFQVESREREEQVSHVRVGACLTSDAAMLFMGKDKILYNCEMFFSPDDFSPDSVERMFHE